MDEKLERSLTTMVEGSIRNLETSDGPLRGLFPETRRFVAEYIVARCKTRIDSAISAARADGLTQGYDDGFRERTSQSL